MDFEHVIQINDPRLPDAVVVDAAALWTALLRAAREPWRVRPELDTVEVRPISELCWRRTLGFGALEVIDEISADVASARITQRILAPPTLAGGSRTVAIESPAPGHLILRFRYHSPHVDADPQIGEDHRSAFRSAYLQSDLTQVRLLRGIIEGTLPHR